MNHPTEAGNLLYVCPEGIRIYSWHSLKEVHNVESDSASPKINRLSLHSTSLETRPVSVERASLVHSTLVAFETRPQTRMSGTNPGIELVDIAPSASRKSQPDSVETISGQVNHLIGSFDGHVVFLDHHYRFCTWNPERGPNSVKSHFFLSKEWLSPGMLELCVVDSYGTILCPKNGEVAVIRSGINL